LLQQSFRLQALWYLVLLMALSLMVRAQHEDR
jgi:hypothetical protein